MTEVAPAPPTRDGADDPRTGPAPRARGAGSAGRARDTAVRGYLAATALLRGVLARPLASYYLLVASAGLLLVIGLAMVFSATSVEAYVANGNAFTSIEKQATSAAVGLVAFWICQRLPVRTYRSLAKPGLIGAGVLVAALDLLILLAQTNVLHHPRFGPIRADELWLYLGPLQVQPSELAKLALVVWVADVMVRKGGRVVAWRELSRPLFPVVGLVCLLVGYKDLGTMLCLLVLFVGILFAAGVRLRIFAGMLGVALLGIVALIYLPGDTYRLDRIDAFTHPELNQLGTGYQVREGLFAIANGGWFGVGLGQGRLKWGWLPNGHNDFIFAVIAEELGVVGCLVVLALFAVLAYTGLRVGRRVNHPFRRLVCAGVISLIAGQAVINIGGVVGLVPVTGIPLPLISDGGSALVVTMAMIGMLASFARAEPLAARTLHARPPGRVARLLWAPLPPMPIRAGHTGAAGGERGSEDG
jgi:cell division protein FtsW